MNVNMTLTGSHKIKAGIHEVYQKLRGIMVYRYPDF